MTSWQLQNAKTHFSEVIEDANTKGPQVITRHGAERAVVVSLADYTKLSHGNKAEKKQDLIELLMGGPKLAYDDPFFRAVKREHHRRDVDFDD